jgi:hypothetical protein
VICGARCATEEAFMSAKNGDKARYQKNRKRAVLRRSKMREMVYYQKEAAAVAAKKAEK